MDLLLTERLYSFTELATQPLCNGRRLAERTLHLWRHGLRGVKLETTKRGHARLTSLEALQRFWGRLAPQERPVVIPESKRTAAKRHKVATAILNAAFAKMHGEK